MAYYSIYFSPTGGTKRAADIIIETLCRDFIEINLCKELNDIEINPDDVCVISVPSYGGRVPDIAAQRLRKISGNGARAILNCVYGNRAWEDTLTELEDIMRGGGFRCIGAIAAVAEHSIFRQYAAGRPDEQDETELRDFALRLRNRLDENISPNLELPGNHGKYKDFGGSPLKPIVDSTVCHGCGICAEECPTGAIDTNNPMATDSDRCISCMSCISICPNHARSLNPELFQQLEQLIGPRLAGRKQNHLYL